MGVVGEGFGKEGMILVYAHVICSEPFTRTAHRLDGPGPFARQTVE